MPAASKVNTSPTRLALGREWAAHVKAVRERHGLTQGQLADRLGISRAHVRSCEQGRRCYSLAVRRKVVAEMGGDPAILRADEDVCPHCGHPAE